MVRRAGGEEDEDREPDSGERDEALLETDQPRGGDRTSVMPRAVAVRPNAERASQLVWHWPSSGRGRARRRRIARWFESYGPIGWRCRNVSRADALISGMTVAAWHRHRR